MEKDFFCTRTEPSVKTTAGYVRGYRFDGIYTFLGVPYGQAKRFHMPEPHTPWEGYRDTTIPGFNSPSLGHSQAIDCFPHNFWIENEDCLNLNVWTSTLDSSGKKPVLVWLHGGGFAYGSPLRQPAYEGAALSKEGGAVVVSITNRLNIFGHMDLSAFGDEYANSGNVGIADLVLAMKWIQNNISAFGGDPDNVTICGQSGGGGKVVALMQCPEANGTFHKAMILSGLGLLSLRSVGMADVPVAMLEELGAPTDDISPLEKLPTAELIRLYKKTLPRLKAKGITPSFGPLPNTYFAAPPSDVLPDFAFSEHAKTIPLILGSTFTEMNLSADLPDGHSMTETQMLEKLRSIFGTDTDYLVGLFRKCYPDMPILELGHLDAMVRCAAYRFLDKRIAACSAPTWAYIFTPEIKYNGGIPAWHSSDMAYLFHNVSMTPVANIVGASDLIEAQYSGMWLQFAKKGDPSNAAFSELWRPYTKEDPAVMVINEHSEMRTDYDRELVSFLDKHYIDLMRANRLRRPSLVGI